MIRCKVLVIILCIVFFTGCAAHVDDSSLTIPDTSTVTFGSISFAVPNAALSEAVDYHTITDFEYPTIENRDEAIVNLIQSTVFGTNDAGYLLMNSREFLFYVSKADNLQGELTNLDRNQLFNMLSRSDLNIVNMGRGIVNADAKEKAVVRLDFSVLDSIGVKNTYNGYYGVANIGGTYYTYLAGYKSASEDQLKLCFNCVRSMK